jgi:hypothetical protein
MEGDGGALDSLLILVSIFGGRVSWGEEGSAFVSIAIGCQSYTETLDLVVFSRFYLSVLEARPFIQLRHFLSGWLEIIFKIHSHLGKYTI